MNVSTLVAPERRSHSRRAPALLACCLLIVACSGEQGTASPDGPASDAGQPAPDQATPDTAAPDQRVADVGQPADTLPADVLPADTVNPYAQVSCWTAPPPGAKLASAPKPYSGGSCPTLVAGYNDLQSKGDPRRFLLVVPSNAKPDETFPVLFMWHWLKGKAKSFLEQGEVQQAVDAQRFIAVIPEAKGALDLLGQAEMPWPFTTLDDDARMAEEFAFFDDMLSCVSAQYPVNKECVSSAGVSAGALFTVQLAVVRSQYLSSIVSLSGGSGGGGGVNDFIRPWIPTPHKLPALVLWGGAQDSCVLLNFQVASQKLEQELESGGHFFVECIHNCKHGEPPLAPPAGISKYAGIWEFVFAHPFWLPAGASPLHGRAEPVSDLDWCGIGKGSATIRTGDCDPPGCPI